jgi:predicted metal-dependent hydrolase
VELDGLLEGIRLFNAGQFFESHEVLEDLWRAAPENDKKFLQGLTQLAVAFHHHSTSNLVGCRSVLARALRNLAAYPQGLLNMRTDEILQAVTPCRLALEESRSIPELPKLRIHSSERHGPEAGSSNGEE